MKILYPMRLLFLPSLLFIILIHFKRHQLMEVEISSVKLWDEVIEEISAVKKNKINKYLLLILQLLIAALIIILMTKPIFMNASKDNKVTIAVDCSVSMKSYEKGKTHFEKAKEEIIQYLNDVDDKTKIDLVALKNNSEILEKNISKKEALTKVEKLVCSSEALNIQKASTVLLSCSSPKIVFSDKNIMLGDKLTKVENSMKNLGVIYGNYDNESNTAYCKIRNYGSNNRKAIVVLKDEKGIKKDVQEVSIPAEKEVEISWSNVSKNISLINFSIENEDILSIDNSYILPVNSCKYSNVLMIGENYFIEKTLICISNIKLEIKEKWDEQCTNYDFYVINNKAPIQIPKGAGVWWTNPASEFIEGKVNGNKKLNILKDNITKNIRDIDVYASDVCTLKDVGNYKKIIKVNQKPAMMYKQSKNVKEIYSTIDWNKSSISVTPGFPILVHNILKWGARKEKTLYQVGEIIYPEEENKLILIKPMGNKVKINREPIVLNDMGIYKLIYEETDNIKNIVVNPPSSMICDENLMEDTHEQLKVSLIDIKSTFVIILLCLFIAEWEVYKCEYIH